jgi:hypothetical protein
VDGVWIRLPLLEPKERSPAVTKSPKVRIIAFALIGQEEPDIDRL